MKRFDCTKVSAARKLVKLIEVEIPPDYESEQDKHGQILTEIRRLHSNYEALYGNLPACPCPNHEAYDFECPNRAIARDTLMWAANGLVELSYRQWLSNRAG